MIETLQPVGIAALVDEFLRVQIYEVDALVTSGSLNKILILLRNMRFVFGVIHFFCKSQTFGNLTHHNRQVMTISVGQRPIATQYKVLDLEKVLQIAGMIANHLCDMVQFELIHKALFKAVLQKTKNLIEIYIQQIIGSQSGINMKHVFIEWMINIFSLIFVQSTANSEIIFPICQCV